MDSKLIPVILPKFQDFLHEQIRKGIRFAPAQSEITETEHLWAYRHPATNEVYAMVEVPRTPEGIDLENEKVFYILSEV